VVVDELGVAGMIALAVLGFWFLISIPYQFADRYWSGLKKANTFALIPGWTFFAPTPGTTDYRFVFRDVVPAGHTDWQEIRWCNARCPLDAIWHPQRHRTKLVVDCVSAFLITIQEMRKLGFDVDSEPDSWMLSVPYMALLNVAVSMPRTSPDATARQFAVLERSPFDSSGDDAKLLVCSSPHEF
jgi:hypothetical protein